MDKNLYRTIGTGSEQRNPADSRKNPSASGMSNRLSSTLRQGRIALHSAIELSCENLKISPFSSQGSDTYAISVDSSQTAAWLFGPNTYRCLPPMSPVISLSRNGNPPGVFISMVM